MSNYQLHKSIDILPPDLQEEVATFVAFLCFKKAITIPPDQQKLPLKFGAAKGKFGIVVQTGTKTLILNLIFLMTKNHEPSA